MILRKINAFLSLIASVLLLDHAIFFSIRMLSRGVIPKTVDAIPWILVAIMVIHAVMSIILLILGRKGSKNQQHVNKYLKMNVPTLVQRISGFLMILLLALHIIGAINHFQPKLLHAILHPIFFASVLAHVSISVSKALITLGVGNAKVIRIVDIVIGAICGAVLVAGVIGFYLCLFLGVKI